MVAKITYGFELELSIQMAMIANGKLQQLPSGIPALYIIDKNKNPLYEVTGDLGTTDPKDPWRTCEIVSVFPNIGLNLAIDQTLAPITDFLKYLPLKTEITFEPNTFTDLSANYQAYCLLPPEYKLVIYSLTTVEKTTVNPQFTFGFNSLNCNLIKKDVCPESILKRMYLTYLTTRDELQQGEIAKSLVYSVEAWNIFDALLTNQKITVNDETLYFFMQAWTELEFLRGYLINASFKNKQPEFGNKALLTYLARTKFSRGIISNYTGLLTLDFCIEYFMHTMHQKFFRKIFFFDPIGFNPMVTANYSKPDRSNPVAINNTLTQTLSVRSIMDGILYINDQVEPLYEKKVKQLQELAEKYSQYLIKNAKDNGLLDPDTQYEMLNQNIEYCDLLSPVPYSINSDAMGFISRDQITTEPYNSTTLFNKNNINISTIKIPSYEKKQRFIIEARHVRQRLERIYGERGYKLPFVWNTDFQTVLIEEMNLAYNNWL